MINMILLMFFGLLLGIIYFGGLWWTVHHAVVSARPASWFFGSLLLRVGLTLGGFYLAAGDDWKRPVACLLGFIAARSIVIRLTLGSDK